MNRKETAHATRQQCREYQDSLYAQYPQAAKFQRQKSRVLLFLMLLYLLCILPSVLTSLGSGYLLLRTLTSCGTHLIFLFAAMSAHWKMAFLLYGLGLYRLAMIVYSCYLLKVGWLSMFSSVLARSPLLSFFLIAELLYPLCLLAAAAWLTIPKGRRELTKQTEQMNSMLMEYAKELNRTNGRF